MGSLPVVFVWHFVLKVYAKCCGMWTIKDQAWLAADEWTEVQSHSEEYPNGQQRMWCSNTGNVNLLSRWGIGVHHRQNLTLGAMEITDPPKDKGKNYTHPCGFVLKLGC